MGHEPEGTSEAELSAQHECIVEAPRALVWAIAGDSNRWDRLVRAGPSAYTTEVIEGEEGRLLVGHGTLVGMPASWLERGEWLEGEFLVGERRYLSGPLSVAGFRLDVATVDGGTRAQLRAYMTPAQPIPEQLSTALLRNMEKASEKYLTALFDLVSGADVPPMEDEEPAAVYARRVLLSLEPSRALDGRPGEVHEEHLSYCVGKLESASIDADHRNRIVEFVRTRADAELEQIRPFELARSWHLKRRPLLRAFLHAATAGLFELRWQLNCPRCRVGAESSAALADIGKRAHCDMCDIDFDIDFASNVEAVFRANPGIRAIADRVYCTSSPWFRPHVFAVVELSAGESRRLEMPPLARGALVRTLRGDRHAIIDSSARLTIGTRRVDVEPLDTSGVLQLVNDTDRVCVVLVERRQANAFATRGTDIMTQPEFLDLYGTEAPATGVDLSVGSVTVLFSDLTQSTELYRSLGDARAFSLVQEHFRDMAAIVGSAGGAVLKTMGDAVMASFADPADAVRAAFQMIESTRSRHAAHSFHLKVGVHNGPCVIVRANGRLDLFGTTVNIASRLQEQARADQLVMVESLLEHADVAGELSARKLSAEFAPARLKGLETGYTLATITVPQELDG